MREERFPLGALSRLRMGTDGCGIKTLAAAAGCRLSCRYCLNPGLMDQSRLKKWITPEELLDYVQIDHLYFLATGGGIAFGGGEPLLYSRFIRRFCEICPPEWTIAVETALAVDEEEIRCIAGTRAHILADIKTLDPDVYLAYTGKPLSPVLSNLKLLIALAGPERIKVRVPLIPGYTNETMQEQTCRILQEMGIRFLETFQYRT